MDISLKTCHSWARPRSNMHVSRWFACFPETWLMFHNFVALVMNLAFGKFDLLVLRYMWLIISRMIWRKIRFSPTMAIRHLFDYASIDSLICRGNQWKMNIHTLSLPMYRQCRVSFMIHSFIKPTQPAAGSGYHLLAPHVTNSTTTTRARSAPCRSWSWVETLGPKLSFLIMAQKRNFRFD